MTKIELPLTGLLCDACRTPAGGGLRDRAFTPFHVALVDVNRDDLSLEPLTVSVDVQRIQWTREKPGRYSACATVLLPCPCCASLREMQCHLDAPLVLVTSIGKCRVCMGPLELESEEIDYRDAGGGNFLVDIRATLFCRHCLTAGPQSAQVPVSDWAQFRASDNIHVQLSPPRSTGAAPIFISYRRADSHDVTGRIFDRLVSRFGADLVMRDVNSVPVGVNFQEFLAHSLHACRVMLVVIGPNWLLARDSSGARRLDDPSDLVRLEVQTALERGIPVIPLFVTGASMPPADQLPDDIKSICARQGLAVRPDPDFDVDVQRLLAALDQSLNEGSRP